MCSPEQSQALASFMKNIAEEYRVDLCDKLTAPGVSANIRLEVYRSIQPVIGMIVVDVAKSVFKNKKDYHKTLKTIIEERQSKNNLNRQQ